jgi:hypothetical protein
VTHQQNDAPWWVLDDDDESREAASLALPAFFIVRGQHEVIFTVEHRELARKAFRTGRILLPSASRPVRNLRYVSLLYRPGAADSPLFEMGARMRHWQVLRRWHDDLRFFFAYRSHDSAFANDALRR